METVTEQVKTSKSNHSIIEVLEFCKTQNLPARVVGRWVWVEFESKPSADIRQAMKDFLPELIIKRTDKIGFDAPVNELFRDDQIIRFCNDIINSESFKARPYWKWEEVDKGVKRHQRGTINIGDTIWKWINLELWLRQFFPDDFKIKNPNV